MDGDRRCRRPTIELQCGGMGRGVDDHRWGTGNGTSQGSQSVIEASYSTYIGIHFDELGGSAKTHGMDPSPLLRELGP
jgi:hypothetical protein